VPDYGGGFDEFVVGRGAALLRFAYLLTGDHGRAEDLVQEALVKAHRHWTGGRRADHPDAYVRRIIINDFASWRRRRASTEVVGEVPEKSYGDATESVVDRDVVWRALARLPGRQRAVLVLRYYEHQPDAAIAALLGCADGTVRSLAARAFATLREDPMIATLESCEELP
jgi:RNA polymerase sigma-70 factor (sigma-E family)